jgi:hypothetical protein
MSMSDGARSLVLTADEEAAMKRRHRAKSYRNSYWCLHCNRIWPCDAARLLLSFAAVENRLREVLGAEVLAKSDGSDSGSGA